MKKNFFISLALVATLFVSAQQKNILLEQSFWKTAPDVNTVKAEIAKGNNPAEANANAFDVAVIAINNDAPLASIKYILDQPGNPLNKSTHDNRIYLHWAAYRGNTELVEYLITKGSDINFEDSHGTTPIAFAAGNGMLNSAVCEAFFKAGLDPKKKYNDDANILLLAIAFDKDLTLTDYLVTKGLSLKDVDKNGNTAFDYAARTGNVPLLKKLAEKGVKHTDNALLIATQGTRRETTPLETYKYLIEEVKIKPTATNKSGDNVLHLLVNKPNQGEIIAYFLAKGVDANKVNKEGNTPFMVAAGARETAALEKLLPVAKNINLQNPKGESALTMAVRSGTPEAVALLLNKGADVNVKDKDSNNLGVYLVQSYRPAGREANAAKDPFEAKTKLLQEKGLNLAAAQKDGSTLYHYAIAKNDLNLIKKLADLKIDVNAKNKDGITALHKAAMVAKDDTILKYLVSIGAKKEINTEFDESAYALAKENESLTKSNISVEFLK
ncbi:ankyrin repeat domain-containing protein [Flavobacterium psychroterrae]|uniref:Ankyrin repeat domain-containing protein n=1 Tax=Flavobacterium psychroterrae TaxID=2133767 RepID=A0ABS5P6Y4_9FLAO|nr:ankyrin repeat domain-containing protein [Flavobacterium psychroterrae]MBS7229521.1 ankyrin repeat domain-containing protein [Flavobacterium psychroterrae]